MALALREPANIVSKYLRTSPTRNRASGSPSRRRIIPVVRLASFHDVRAPPEEEDSDSDIEVLGPFPVSNEKTSTASSGFAKGSTVCKSVHPMFSKLGAENIQISQTVSGPVSSRSAFSKSWTRASKPASKITKSSSSASVDPEPAIDLPTYSYKDYSDPKPYVVYTRDVSEADDLIATLRPGPIAFDMEWCYSRTWNAKERRTAVVQIADSAGLVIIVHLSRMPHFPKALKILIEDPKTPKLGANVLNDGKKLFRDYGILAKNLLELGVVAAAWDADHAIKRKVISLAKLAAKYTGKTLLKGDERSSNWEVPELDELQKDYAANDVHCSLEIFKKLQSLASDPNVEPPPGADVVWHILKDASARSESGGEMRLQWRRAHKLWHEKGMQLHKMCAEMRVRKEGVPDEGPLKTATVISYIVWALQVDPKLPFDVEKLRELVLMDAASWERHRSWMIAAWFRKLEAQQTTEKEEEKDVNSTDVDPAGL